MGDQVTQGTLSNMRIQFSGRVMIDPKMMQQMAPANKVLADLMSIMSIRTASRTCMSDLKTKEQVRCLLTCQRRSSKIL